MQVNVKIYQQNNSKTRLNIDFRLNILFIALKIFEKKYCIKNTAEKKHLILLKTSCFMVNCLLHISQKIENKVAKQKVFGAHVSFTLNLLIQPDLPRGTSAKCQQESPAPLSGDFNFRDS